jgi:hypothetical protein
MFNWYSSTDLQEEIDRIHDLEARRLAEIHKKIGKGKIPGCECNYNFTCGVCLADAAERNAREQKK